MTDSLNAVLDVVLFQQYMQEPEVVQSESFDEWKARRRPVPTNLATTGPA